jgi:antitoxin YefM
MPTKITSAYARAHFADLCDKVTRTRKPIVIRRRGAADVVLMDASELSSLMETLHLLNSPKNAQRLITALRRARKPHRSHDTDVP